MKHQAISDEEFASLTNLPPLGQTHIERSHCSSCGGTLAPGETGKCPACEGAGGGRKNHQRQKQVRTNGGTARESSMQRIAGIAGPTWRDGLSAAIQAHENYRGTKSHVPIGNNTWIHQDDTGAYHVRHHQTDILSYHPTSGNLTVNPDGYHSTTTKQRINALLPANMKLMKHPSKAQGAPDMTFAHNPSGGSIWGSQYRYNDNGHYERDDSQRGKYGLHVNTVLHPYEDGFSINRHSGEVLDDDAVRPTGTVVRPPNARGTGESRPPRARPSRNYYDTGIDYAPATHVTHNPSRPLGTPYTPLAPTHERDDVHEQIRRDLQDADRYSTPQTYGDNVHMQFSHHDDLPAEGESYDEWMSRTAPASRAECSSCRGRGTVRLKTPVPQGVNPWEHREDCKTCEGRGTVPVGKTAARRSGFSEEFLENRTMVYLLAPRVAYGETKAPQQVDTLRDDTCPVCGDSDAYDGDQCQVCGYVTPPKMFQDPDLSRAKLLDLRADPATGQPNDIDPNVGTNLPPVDPSAVDDQGNVIGDGSEADAVEAQTGVVEGEVEGLGDAGTATGTDDARPSAEPGGVQDPQADAQQPGADTDEDGIPDNAEQPVTEVAGDAAVPGNPEDLDENGEFANEQAGGAAPEDAEESGAEPNSPGPKDPAAAEQRVTQGGEPFTPGPDAPVPAEPMEPGVVEAIDDEEAAEAGVPEQGDGQVAGTGDQGVPGTPGDGVADLLCPACGFEAGAAAPTSTSMDPNAPADGGDGMLEGDICPNCQKATLMGTGQVQQAEQAGLMP